MHRGNHSSPVPADSASRARFIVSLTIVLALHLLVFWLLKSPPAAQEKRPPPNLIIELGKAPPAGAAGQEVARATGAQAVAPPKAPPPAAPRPQGAAPARPPAQAPSPLPVPAAKDERRTPADSPAQSQAQAAPPTKPEPAPEPAAQGGAKAAIESVRTAEADYKAAYLNNSRPPYPRNAHRFGIEGTVVLQAEVNEEGVPLQVRVFQSSGNELLDESALTTVAKWRFSPARKDGVIVRSFVKIPITFSLRANPVR